MLSSLSGWNQNVNKTLFWILIVKIKFKLQSNKPTHIVNTQSRQVRLKFAHAKMIGKVTSLKSS